MILCSTCLYPKHHPLGLVLDEQGVCSGCRTHESRAKIDWDAQKRALLERVNGALRSRPERIYDCVIPVSGNPESFVVVDLAVNELGLHPLLTLHNSYFNTEVGIKNLALLRSEFNLELRVQNPNFAYWQELVRTCLVSLGNLRWPFLAGQSAFAYWTAIQLGIPLVIHGENQGLEQVGMFHYRTPVEHSRWYRREHDLVQWDESAVRRLSFSTRLDMSPYTFPPDTELIKAGVCGIYLGVYMPWDHRKQQKAAVDRFGIETALQVRSPDPYDHPEDTTYLTVHDLLKQLKFGYSRITDLLVREIRHGRISRDSALEIEAEYMSRWPDHVPQIADHLGMDPGGLEYLVLSMSDNPSYQDERNAVSNYASALAGPSATNSAHSTWATFLNSYTPPTMNISGNSILVGRGL